MPDFVYWDNQQDADDSLAAVDAVYILPFSDGDYVMQRWDFVTKSDSAELWGFCKPEIRFNFRTLSPLMGALIAGYTEVTNRPDGWVLE